MTAGCSCQLLSQTKKESEAGGGKGLNTCESSMLKNKELLFYLILGIMNIKSLENSRKDGVYEFS